MKIKSLAIPMFLVFSMFLLSSCSLKTTKQSIETLDWEQRQAQLATLTHWTLRARIGIRSQQVNGSASLIWDEEDDGRVLNLLGPLGGGAIHLEQNQDGATLTDSKGRSWYNSNARELIRQSTGWEIPVSGLRWWILGLTEPGSSASYSFDEQNRLQSIQQQGWLVTYNKYKSFGPYELPSSITVTGYEEVAEENPVRVKLVIKEWEIKD
jgi:outer membrane lipoprotein LolB